MQPVKRTRLGGPACHRSKCVARLRYHLVKHQQEGTGGQGLQRRGCLNAAEAWRPRVAGHRSDAERRTIMPGRTLPDQRAALTHIAVAPAAPVEYAVAVEAYLAGAWLSEASRRVYRISLTSWAWPLVGRDVPAGRDRRGAVPPIVPLALLDSAAAGPRLAAAVAGRSAGWMPRPSTANCPRCAARLAGGRTSAGSVRTRPQGYVTWPGRTRRRSRCPTANWPSCSGLRRACGNTPSGGFSTRRPRTSMTFSASTPTTSTCTGAAGGPGRARTASPGAAAPRGCSTGCWPAAGRAGLRDRPPGTRPGPAAGCLPGHRKVPDVVPASRRDLHRLDPAD